jgi:ADP-ribose pyrophosphatase YjhB (NUDIX family)
MMAVERSAAEHSAADCHRKAAEETEMEPELVKQKAVEA